MCIVCLFWGGHQVYILIPTHRTIQRDTLIFFPKSLLKYSVIPSNTTHFALFTLLEYAAKTSFCVRSYSHVYPCCFTWRSLIFFRMLAHGWGSRSSYLLLGTDVIALLELNPSWNRPQTTRPKAWQSYRISDLDVVRLYPEFLFVLL